MSLKAKERALSPLIKILQEEKHIVVTIDNDCWWIERSERHPEYEEDSEDNVLIDDTDIPYYDSGYGCGNTYGGDILQALAIIHGVKVESV